MTKKTLGNFLHGKPKIIGNPKNSNSKVYSLHEFFLENPVPTHNSNILYLRSFYDALHEINDVYLPEEQRKIRSNLLVKIGIYCGKIKQNSGARI